MKKAITQEDFCGCAVACVAFVLGISYQSALSLFANGQRRAIIRGFYCRDIVRALNKVSKNKFVYRKVKNSNFYKNNTIVFIARSKKYPLGHFLVRHRNLWMDPFINFPHIINVRSGFRKRLPGRPIYEISVL